MPTKAVPKKLAIPLPAGILISDIQCSKNTADWIYGENGNFELWYTERFGWCIPTLHIRNPGRRHMSGVPARTYGITIADKNLDGHQVVTMGLGPHVKARHTVYVTKSRAEALQKFLDIRMEGLEKAGSIRDRISTRRARTSERRGLLGW